MQAFIELIFRRKNRRDREWESTLIDIVTINIIKRVSLVISLPAHLQAEAVSWVWPWTRAMPSSGMGIRSLALQEPFDRSRLLQKQTSHNEFSHLTFPPTQNPVVTHSKPRAWEHMDLLKGTERCVTGFQVFTGTISLLRTVNLRISWVSQIRCSVIPQGKEWKNLQK